MSSVAKSAAKDSGTGLAKDRDNHLEEWKQARDTLKSFDDRLHDLRKLGFSFLTALFAAGSLLTPAIIPSTSSLTPVIISSTSSADSPTSVQNIVKSAIFAVTLLLVIALHFLDKNYRVAQEAADTRAVILERELNLELSDIITVRYNRGHVYGHVLWIYIIFTVGVALLGGFILYPDWLLIIGLAICMIFVLVVVICQHFKLTIAYKIPGLKEDWTISPLECTENAQNALVRITLTNITNETKRIETTSLTNKPKCIKVGSLAIEIKWIKAASSTRKIKVPKPIIFQEGELIWEIKDDEGKIVYVETAKNILEVYESFTWIRELDIDYFKRQHIYQLTLTPRKWPFPLSRKIVIS